MEMDLVGIKNQNEYYTNHFFTSIFKDNAEDTIKAWKAREKEEEIQLPWKKLRDISKQYYRIRERYQISKNENSSKYQIQELAEFYLNALGFEQRNSVIAEVADNISVPVYHEEIKSNGAPLFWAFLSVSVERGDDILKGKIFKKSIDEDEQGKTEELINDDILAKLFFAGDEAPRFIMLIGINQIVLIDRNKWNEKRYLQFMMEDIYSRHEETTFMAMTVLLHKESLCPDDGAIVLDSLDENSHKHSAGVSESLKYALRECIEILGNEVVYDMKTRLGIDLSANPVDASQLTIECLRYMYRFLFMLFIEARPELGYAPMKSQTYVQGYSLEGLRDVCDRIKDESEVVSEGYYIDDTVSELFRMIYEGYPGDLDAYKKALELESTGSVHDVFTIEALKAHIFDPEYTRLITKARLRNSAMIKIVNLMSISRPSGRNERKGRISYSALGINQMGAVYEALLSYRGFIAEETLFEVKRKGEKFNELDVGYFIPERELDNYEEDERVRYEKGEQKGQLRKYEQGTFIYRLAGREREKSASYYTPEVLTKCLVKYALKELLKGKSADEILSLTICEPAMGSAAFLNEAIDQLAEAYLNKKQAELGKTISFDQKFEELQKVKMFIADRNVYGVDLNPIAVELAEVSLWLNTIYKGAYVPWFGTQLVCGNSLVGARRQVYLSSQLEAGKWWEKAPTRIVPGEPRTRKGQHEKTKGIYHFLLGDAGMTNYTDKVIKGLEPDNIKQINDWRKGFTAKHDENDIQTLLSLSESIDNLWQKTIELRKTVEKATYEPLSVFGHDETQSGSHTTIREKDAIYKQLFKSEHMNNAGPYARLKAAMDYWCALWFWPIDKADLLPDRQTFFFEMSLILEGTINAVSTSASGQMSFVDSTGNASYDETGEWNFTAEGSQIALDFQAQYAMLGTVNLDELREKHERLAIANQIAEEQRFQHWELEFADIFEDKGGFDLIIGNPPWLVMEWKAHDIMSEYNPLFDIRKLSSKQSGNYERELWGNCDIKRQLEAEYVRITGHQQFMCSTQNYDVLAGIKTDLYKGFLPLVWYIANDNGISGLLHPEGVYDDAKGGELRSNIYSRLISHFQFHNQKKLFPIGNTRSYGINIYGSEKEVSFEAIYYIVTPSMIDDCYEIDCNISEVGGIKDDNNNWNEFGNKHRVVKIDENTLKLFVGLLYGEKKWKYVRMPMLFTDSIREVLVKFNRGEKLGKYANELIYGEMWTEPTSTEDVVKRETAFPNRYTDLVYCGPHISVANPMFKTPRRICETHKAYDEIFLDEINEEYVPRNKYILNMPREDVERLLIQSDGSNPLEYYRVLSRKMIDKNTERTLASAIVPPSIMHMDSLYSIAFKNARDTALLEASFATIVFDFYVKVTGKSNFRLDLAAAMPLVSGKENERLIRVLLLNCINKEYGVLWEKCWSDDFRKNTWLQNDPRLNNDIFEKITNQWTNNCFVRNDFARRELLVELDVIVAMQLGISLDELIMIYKTYFPVMQQYEQDTWYDKQGKVIFTNNRGLSNTGVTRKEWENIKDMKDGKYVKTYEDDNSKEGLLSKEIVFYAPFDRCSREDDYRNIWKNWKNHY